MGLGHGDAEEIAVSTVLSALSGAAEAQSVAPERKALPKDARCCHSWGEAHERTLASLNNGRPPYP
jgi:hypothetical protein